MLLEKEANALERALVLQDDGSRGDAPWDVCGVQVDGFPAPVSQEGRVAKGQNFLLGEVPKRHSGGGRELGHPGPVAGEV
mgnify:CR=1 FL=1